MLAKKYIRSEKTQMKVLSASYVAMPTPNIHPVKRVVKRVANGIGIDIDNDIDIDNLTDNTMSNSVVNHSVVQTVKYDIKQAQTYTDNQIIPYSYCGFCGTKFNNLDWPRVFRCFKNETFPGGFVNWTELWEETISREMLEETGIITAPEKYIYLQVTKNYLQLTKSYLRLAKRLSLIDQRLSLLDLRLSLLEQQIYEANRTDC